MAPMRLTIAPRFAGPPGTGNGGYTSGRLAAHVDTPGPVTVTLRQPAPLGTEMAVEAGADEVSLLHGDRLIAEAQPGELAEPVVVPVDQAFAVRAQSTYRGRTHHPFPGCFVCGTHPEGEGLRLAPGLVAAGLTACVWTPGAWLADRVAGDVAADVAADAAADADAVGEEFAWAALDCPAGWTSDLQRRPLVLGRMTAECLSPPVVGRPHLVVGRLLREEGRKNFTAAALYDDAGQLLARAEHVWIAVDLSAFASRLDRSATDRSATGEAGE